MKGDFTRDTFRPEKNYSRVLMQQGRVQLDADWNEQVSIILNQIREVTRDIIGPYGGPIDSPENVAQQGDHLINDPGFKIEIQNNKMLLSCGRDKKGESCEGRYYIDGILCNMAKDFSSSINIPDSTFLIYLDVWEEHITHLDDQSICEVALGGPDTANRTKVIWQVRIWSESDYKKIWGKTSPQYPTSKNPQWSASDVDDSWDEWTKLLYGGKQGMLKAKAINIKDTIPKEPCIISPESRYRGTENQLYRVEIHRSGFAWDEEIDSNDKETTATFKWSRENGSVVFPITDNYGNNLVLEHLGRDLRSSLAEGDWVEVIDKEIDAISYFEDNSSSAVPEPLWQVVKIDPVDRIVTFKEGLEFQISSKSKSPHLRRWDHKGLISVPNESNAEGLLELNDIDGAAYVKNSWLDLEDGISVWFGSLIDENKTTESGYTNRFYYRSGDYWLLPARVATGNVEWPQDEKGEPASMSPDGVRHHYAPLYVRQSISGGVNAFDCRRKFKRKWIY